jgi:1-pyrroline-5-carboxylate dehydrogenase
MMKPSFVNEPLTDFSDPVNCTTFRQGLTAIQDYLGRDHPLVIGGERLSVPETIASYNPARPAQVIGRVAQGTPELAGRAVAAAAAAFETWRQVPYAERARYLFSAASILRTRKHELSALIMLEVGKTWDEADGETAEAIDFLEFYGREMLRLGPPQPTVTAPDREIELLYVPLGVGIVIPPWNFPAAIMAGMTSAAIAAGNTVVLKPSSSSPVIAAWFVDLLNDTLRLPPGVLNFLPGSGSAVGDPLVDHPLTRFVAFTGSKEVGVRIFERAARVQPGQKWLKRTVLEMGGKDAILVDETADLDAAATGIVAAAFGFSGQKCSACSRVIAVDAIYEPLIEKVVALARLLQVGDPSAGPEITIGPVIAASALQKHLEYIAIGRREGRLLLGGEVVPTPTAGHFLAPTIFADIPPTGRLAQEEVFGPVLACIRACGFEEGLAIANNTEFGLTGAVYSRRRDRLERARRDFQVGNLYFNRKCTGAFVGQEPFGGFNMSGTDSKAGGSDYLLLFTQAKVVSELL